MLAENVKADLGIKFSSWEFSSIHIQYLRPPVKYSLSLLPFQINSPVQLINSNVERSYLSLQPPPGRAIDDNIQFETLDLYLWTGSQFGVPSLLFYAGPVYQEETDDINVQLEEPSSEVK